MSITSPYRIVQIALLVYSSLFAAGAQAQADATQTVLEQNGYVLFEPESLSMAEGWVVNAELPGYRGSGYLQWTGENYFSKADAGNGTLSFPIRIQVAGNYEFRWRTRIATGDSNTESNDSWVRFPTAANVLDEHPLDGWTKVFIGEIDVWTWSARTVDGEANRVRQYFDAGDHVLQISGRSTGHAIDRIALYRYEDVSFDTALNGTLLLSPLVKADGSIVVPEEDAPVETVPDPTMPDPIERINVEPVTTPIASDADQRCQANSVMVPIESAASINLQDSFSGYDLEQLRSDAGQRGLLLQFDLTQLPPISTATLQYSTGSEPANGTLDIHLGSHGLWAQDTGAAHPDATVLLATIQGGWDANARYQSTLDASLLGNTVSTLILTSRDGSEPFVLAPVSDAMPSPQLVVSGGDGFCEAWLANLAAQSAPDETETADPTPSTARTSKGGSILPGSVLLLLLWMLAVVACRNVKLG